MKNVNILSSRESRKFMIKNWFLQKTLDKIFEKSTKNNQN